METKLDPQVALDQAFREHALVVGGLVAEGLVSEELAWQLIHSLRASRLRAVRLLVRRRENPRNRGRGGRAHPAVSEFLKELERV